MQTKYFLIASFITFTIIGCANTISSSKKAPPKVIDPVCAYLSDMGCINIAVDENTPKSTYEGVTYYFCSMECKMDFDKNPSKYLKHVTLPPKDAVDPICHTKIDGMKRFVTCLYRDRVYYFCSDHCRTKYMETPDQYSQKE